MVGNTLSHYRLIEKLGEGGMGIVYRAEDLTLRRYVAIKIFPSFVTASPDDRNRFFQEARLASSLNHPNIVTIHEFDESEGTAFIVSECVEGNTLALTLQTGRLAVEEILRIGLQIAAGISEAHSHGIVHRDIKPENVMISVHGQAKVMDFGLARLMGSSHMTAPGSLIGTFSYMSPEQIDEEEIDARSDIFSFGALLYQMVTGELPFRGKTVAELLSAITRKNPDPVKKYREGVPEELERIIGKALLKDRSRRYQTMEEMKRDLLRLELNPRTKPRVTALTSTRIKVLAAVTVILGVLLGGYAWWHSRANMTVSRQHKSVAVLPFINATSDTAISYLSIGVADDIRTRLSFIRSLLVKSTSATAHYSGSDVNAAEAGIALGADYVLEGMFRRVGEMIQISTQVVDVKTGNIIRADKLEHPYDAIRNIQEDVSNHIVDALQLTLTDDEYKGLHKVQTNSSAAYESYLRGIVCMISDSRENNETATQMFERAVARDSAFAEAYAMLSMVYTERFWSSYSPDTAWVSKGEATARRALFLDDRLAQAHAALSFALRVKGRYREAMHEVLVTLSLDPHASFSLEDISEFYRSRGEFPKALAYAEQAAEVDPSFNIYRVRGRLLQFQGRYRESIPELERAILRSPSDSWLRGGLLALSYIHCGDLEKAEREIRLAEAVDSRKPETHVTRAMVYTEQHRYTEAAREMDTITEVLHRDYAFAYYAASIYARQNDTARAAAMMQQAFALGNRWSSAYDDPWFDGIRQSVFFSEILSRTKAELDTIEVEIQQQNM